MEYFGIDLISFIKTVGYLGIFSIVFAESGLLVGFFFPGDSLLFTAGFLASQGFLDLPTLLFLTFLGAVLGDSFGYAFGRKIGPALFKREDSLLFHKDNLEYARIFYAEHGPKTILLARFMPVIRTFAPILAGVGKMHYPTFFLFNLIGAGIWAIGMPLFGYYLSALIPDADRYFLPILLAIIIISFLPPVLPLLKNKTQREKIYRFIKNKIG